MSSIHELACSWPSPSFRSLGYRIRLLSVPTRQKLRSLHWQCQREPNSHGSDVHSSLFILQTLRYLSSSPTQYFFSDIIQIKFDINRSRLLEQVYDSPVFYLHIDYSPPIFFGVQSIYFAAYMFVRQ